MSEIVESDYVQTPEWCALDMIEFFKPEGIICDPCYGTNRVFIDNLPKDALGFEITEGKDFFNFNGKVDWLISNPPYSVYKNWLKHSYEVADNIVYLLPMFKVFNALGIMRLYSKLGHIKHIRLYDVGGRIPWSRGRPIAAVHMVRNYFGETSWSKF